MRPIFKSWFQISPIFIESISYLIMRALVKIIEVTAISAMLSPVAPYWKSMWNKRSRLEVNSFIHSQLHKNAQEVWINIPLNLLMNWLLRYKLLLIKALNESIWRRSWKSINTMVLYRLRRSREIEALVLEKFKETVTRIRRWWMRQKNIFCRALFSFWFSNVRDV